MLSSICKTKWGENALILNKVIDCETLTEGHECILIGTTYKEMKLKPSVLDEFKDMYGISGAVQAVKNYSSEVCVYVAYLLLSWLCVFHLQL